jgi:prephenate dehydratase
VALDQCLKFFARYPKLERVPFYDTAGSVKMVMEENGTHAAAIASDVAAAIYGGTILKRSIEDDRRNFTRFFLLYPSKKLPPPRRAKEWKTSLVFTTRNIPGALFRGLSAFALRDLNLTKIESRPCAANRGNICSIWICWGAKTSRQVQNALRHLAEIADFLRVLGSYPPGRSQSSGDSKHTPGGQPPAPGPCRDRQHHRGSCCARLPAHAQGHHCPGGDGVRSD